MIFQAQILSDSSFDPYFKIEFTYEDEGVSIKNGVAEIIRKIPRSAVKYDEESERKLVGIDRTKLELELLHALIKYLYSKGVVKNKK